MSRKPRSVTTFVAVLLTLAATGRAVSAQVTEAELAQRVDSLGALYQELTEERAADRDSIGAAERVRRENEAAQIRLLLDTIRVGPLTVLAFRDQADEARGLFEQVWEESFSNVSASPSLAQTTFTFQWRGRIRRIPVEAGEAVHIPAMNGVWVPSRAAAATRIRDDIAGVLLNDLERGSIVRSWIGSSAKPGRRHPASEQAYRLLAVGPTSLTQGCMRGDSAACLGALGIGLGAPGFSQRLALEELQALVRGGLDASGRLVYARRPPIEIDVIVRACIEGDRGACERTLRELVVSSRATLSNRAGVHLFWYAVAVGAVGAWARAIESANSDPVDALAHISGLPPEDLVSRWRAHVLEARPDPQAGLPVMSLAALFWVPLIAGFALRSTRWRFG